MRRSMESLISGRNLERRTSLIHLKNFIGRLDLSKALKEQTLHFIDAN